MSRRTPEIRIGTSGYQYNHWRGIFYPEKLPQNRWLQYYSQHFDTVEINNTFYRLPSEQAFDSWRDQARKGFLYVLKFSRYGSHLKKLKEPQEPVFRFMSLASRLDGFLGPILVQLPPRWHIDPGRLEDFLDAVPGNQRWAIELRDPSWFHEDVYSILRRHNAALCFHDMIKDHPRPETADWIYQRFHGTSGHSGNYSRQQLEREAKLIKQYLAQRKDVFAYFNNDVHGYAIANALDLRGLVT
ncbi:MAG: DUF72 domain-containing protein [Acidobacteria bacterium]|nr:DUF72 domain-containing protein [Acidobacteriota bacterium]